MIEDLRRFIAQRATVRALDKQLSEAKSELHALEKNIVNQMTKLGIQSISFRGAESIYMRETLKLSRAKGVSEAKLIAAIDTIDNAVERERWQAFVKDAFKRSTAEAYIRQQINDALANGEQPPNAAGLPPPEIRGLLSVYQDFRLGLTGARGEEEESDAAATEEE